MIKHNYKSIALVTAASIFLKLCLSVIVENYLFTHDQQLGFKSKLQLTFAYIWYGKILFDKSTKVHGEIMSISIIV